MRITTSSTKEPTTFPNSIGNPFVPCGHVWGFYYFPNSIGNPFVPCGHVWGFYYSGLKFVESLEQVPATMELAASIVEQFADRGIDVDIYITDGGKLFAIYGLRHTIYYHVWRVKNVPDPDTGYSVHGWGGHTIDTAIVEATFGA